MMNHPRNHENKNIPLYGIIGIILLGAISILILPWAFTRSCSYFQGFGNPSDVGSAINGISTPFIAIGAAILTFLAFWEQYKANLKQRMQFAIQSFESRLFTLLEFHRENVSSIEVEYDGQKWKGQDAFEILFYELRDIYTKLHAALNDIASDEKIFNLSYLIFYFGLDTKVNIRKPKSFSTAKEMSEQTDLGPLYNAMIERQVFQDYSYCGRITLIGQYFWSVYDVVRYIDKHSEDNKFSENPIKFPFTTCYQYSSLLRNQLGLFEQVILYYNSLNKIADGWTRDGSRYIDKYCLTKRVPWPIADFYLTPPEYLQVMGFADGNNQYGMPLFDWQHEMKKSFQSFAN